jgi:hypothetical protein
MPIPSKTTIRRRWRIIRGLDHDVYEEKKENKEKGAVLR